MLPFQANSSVGGLFYSDPEAEYVTWNRAVKNLHHCGQGDIFRALDQLEFVKSKYTPAGIVESTALPPSPSPFALCPCPPSPPSPLSVPLPMNWEACCQLLNGKLLEKNENRSRAEQSQGKERTENF